jgi:hypothetical protein
MADPYVVGYVFLVGVVYGYLLRPLAGMLRDVWGRLRDG